MTSPSAQLSGDIVAGLACDVCGRFPHPRRTRLSLAKLLAILPVEFALHAAVLWLHPPFLVTVTSLAAITTVLVIWVVEPSAMHLFHHWLHAPTTQRRSAAHRLVEDAPALWRLRLTLDDRPGALEAVAHELAQLRANILGLHIHTLSDGVCDELIISSPNVLDADDIATAALAGGGRAVHIWPTTALALIDGQTRALTLSARVIADPGELPHAIADLLDAQIVTDRLTLHGTSRLAADDATVLKVPSPWSGLFAFVRPGNPFTPAESARANRLAEVAEVASLSAARTPGSAYERQVV